MNLCIVSFQAVFLAVLIQYHYINEVDAEKESYVSVGDMFSSMEKRIDNIPDEQGVYQQIKKTTEKILAYPRSLIQQAFGTELNLYEGVKISDLLNSQEPRDLLALNHDSDMTVEVTSEGMAEGSRQVDVENEEAPKRKRRIKKHKKKNKGKRIQRDHREHLPHEQRLDASVEQEKVSLGKKSAKKIMRKNHKKREKERANQRKFVKSLPKESNSSESDEVKRRQPVDIIVHIKMND